MTAKRKPLEGLRLLRFTMEEWTARIPEDDESRTPHLRPSYPEHHEGFVIDRKNKTIDIWWRENRPAAADQRRRPPRSGDIPLSGWRT